jgi:hypothetical protein
MLFLRGQELPMDSDPGLDWLSEDALDQVVNTAASCPNNKGRLVEPRMKNSLFSYLDSQSSHVSDSTPICNPRNGDFAFLSQAKDRFAVENQRMLFLGLQQRMRSTPTIANSTGIIRSRNGLLELFSEVL